jgi:hypothetical protein
MIFQIEKMIEKSFKNKKSFAEAVGISRTSLYRILNEKVFIPEKMLNKLSDKIGLNVIMSLETFEEDILFLSVSAEQKKWIKNTALTARMKTDEYIFQAIKEKYERDKEKEEKYGRFSET